jgi:DNA-binding LacI/PurR family transcriptional regulator
MAETNGRPTIRDVARAAGVSHQTVSRVLNEHPKVAPATRERVLRAMRQLGFQRNLAAQMLTTQRSRTIQVITVDGGSPFEVPLLNSTEGGDYFAIYSECTLATLPQMLDMAAARLVEGIFLYAPQMRIDDDELLAMCHGIPVVRRDFALGWTKVTWVGYDQVRATQLAVEHLIDLDHREIAEVTGSLKAINASLRHETWKKTLLEHGLEGMRQIVTSGARFTAVMVANDLMAIGALHALRESGLRVPEDVSVVSFDNRPHAPYLNPPLTTVAFDFGLQNRLVFQFLFQLIKNPDTPPHPHVLLADLVVRQSTRALEGV